MTKVVKYRHGFSLLTVWVTSSSISSGHLSVQYFGPAVLVSSGESGSLGWYYLLGAQPRFPQLIFVSLEGIRIS